MVQGGGMEHTMNENQTVLLLADGTEFFGKPMGAAGKAVGTVVFHTGMVGYQENLISPSNSGLLLAQTFPLIGNYGVIDGKSAPVRAGGYIVREICASPSNYRCEGKLEDFLRDGQVVGICGVDTRRLTRHIREKGEMTGMIFSGPGYDREALLEELSGWHPAFAPETEAARLAEVPGAKKTVAVLGEFTPGMQALFARRQVQPACFGWDTPAEEILRVKPDGLLLSDGIGDPTAFPGRVKQVQALLEQKLPAFGIGLGHQLLALAKGMEVCRMKCGHRGANQPVYCLANGRTYITAQNHGFVVKSVHDCGEIRFENANDHTVEGLSYRDIPAFSVQFLPDTTPGTQSTSYLYDEFFGLLGEG